MKYSLQVVIVCLLILKNNWITPFIKHITKKKFITVRCLKMQKTQKSYKECLKELKIASSMFKFSIL